MLRRMSTVSANDLANGLKTVAEELKRSHSLLMTMSKLTERYQRQMNALKEAFEKVSGTPSSASDCSVFQLQTDQTNRARSHIHSSYIPSSFSMPPDYDVILMSTYLAEALTDAVYWCRITAWYEKGIEFDCESEMDDLRKETFLTALVCGRVELHLIVHRDEMVRRLKLNVQEREKVMKAVNSCLPSNLSGQFKFTQSKRVKANILERILTGDVVLKAWGVGNHPDEQSLLKAILLELCV
jgi:hypothetical protein